MCFYVYVSHFDFNFIFICFCFLHPSCIDIENLLMKMGTNVQTECKHLTDAINNMLNELDGMWEQTSPILNHLKNYGNVIWLSGVTTSLTTLIVSLILSGGLLLGVIHEERGAKIVFIIGATTISIFSIGLVVFTSIIMLIGGHGELFLCHPLYDAPNYSVITKLFDRPGIVYTNDTIVGIIDDMLRLPDDPSIEHSINVTLASAIEHCERNEGAFSTFHLNRFINITNILDYREFDALDDEIENIFISAQQFSTVTKPLEDILIYMFSNSNINFSSYRHELSHPTPEKDLSTFIEQMQRVSVQIQDSATSSRMSTLGNRARRLQSNILQPLEHLRNDILFELTALQLQKEPWTEMVNQSLIHLKTTQYFINQDATDICYNKSIQFKEKIRSHLIFNKKNTETILMERIALCRPLFDVFDANRHLFCRHIIDPLNGLWFSSLLCIIFWTFLTPISLGMATVYHRMYENRGLTRSNSHQ